MSNSVNKVILIGNLTKDPELRQTPSGTSVCSYTVATNHSWKDANGTKQEKPEYHNIVAWGKLAEICGNYLAKGRKIYLEGRLQTRDWEGEDGVKRYRTEIIAENMVMLNSRGEQMGGSNDYGNDNSMNQAPAFQESEDISIDDLPF